MKFADLELESELMDAVQAMRFDECTPIQEKAIPAIMSGRDVMGIAQTGTGKTAAYLLPVLNMLCKPHDEDHINCIIMSPTRELAQQIDRQMEGFSYFIPVSGVSVYGGNDGALYEQQKRGLTMGADVVIATPGRLISHMKMNYVDLSHVSYFIIDEADKMLDMGFYDDIMYIASKLPAARQTIMFSATMPDKIDLLAKKIMHDPIEIRLEVSKPAEKIMQAAYICYDAQKVELLKYLLKGEKNLRTIIFVASKAGVKEVTRQLARLGLNVAEMHSDLEQAERTRVLNDFKNEHIDVLVATNIISRGIDIDDIKIVINYDVPKECEDYIHRIGRTARANNDGLAITLVNEKDQKAFHAIEKFIDKKIYRIPMPEGMEAPQEIVKTADKKKKTGKRMQNRRKNNKETAGK